MEREDRRRETCLTRLAVILLCLFSVTLVRAIPQQSASVAGAVTDQTGAVITGATVTLSNAAGVKLTTTSDGQGGYKFTGLQPGTYDLSVTATGFKLFHSENLVLTTAQTLSLDISVEPVAESTNVTVQEHTAAQVETETSAVSGTITQKEVVTLSLNGRQ
jgi:hypothetical protein